MAGNKFVPGGVKGFFALHVEKVVLGVCVGLVALFFCLGWSVETLDEEQTPAALYALVERGRSYIAEDSWNDIGPSRTITPNHYERAVKSRQPIEQSYYAMDQYWLWPKFPLEEKRPDPELYPPQHVLAQAFIAPMAVPQRSGKIDRLAGLGPAFEQPPEEPKKIVKPKPRRRRRPRVDEDGFPLDGEEEFLDEELEDEEFLDEEEEMLDEQVVERRPKILSEAQREEIFRGTFQVSSGGSFILEGKTVVAVCCVVPFKKQLEEFDRCFVNAMGYEEDRDRPEYFFMVAERAEVPAEGPVDYSKVAWKVVTNTTFEQQKARFYSVAQVEELVDESYKHPALTSPVPAALMVPAEKFATHPDVAYKTLEELRAAREDAVAIEEGAEPGSLTRSGGLSGVPDALDAAPSSVYSGTDDVDDEFIEDDDLIDDVGIDGEEDEMGVDSGEAAKKFADLLLVRFYDFEAERGKSYVYRVKVFLRDPNNPIVKQGASGDELTDSSTSGEGYSAVPDRMLAEDVIARVKAAQAKKQFYRATEFSDPSPVVRVPDLPQQLMAGPVEPPQYAKLPDGSKVERKEAKAEVLTVTWDDMLGVFIPGLTKASRGSVLNFQAGANVLHPLQLTLKRLEDHFFKTDAMVLDIRGGENLGTSKNPLPTPGEILIVDHNGELVVRNEIDDAGLYRRHLFIEDRGPEEEPSEFGEEDLLDADIDDDLLDEPFE